MTVYRTGTGWTSVRPRVYRHGAHGSGIAAQAMGQSSWQRTGPAHVAFPLFNFFDLFFDLLLLVVHRNRIQIKISKAKIVLREITSDDLRNS